MKLVIANGHVPGVPELGHAPSSNPKSLAPVSGIGGALASLVTHIVDRHHARTRHELRRLAALAACITSADARLDGVLAMLDLFAALERELGAHMTKEEAVIFPYVVSLEAHLLIGRSLARSPFGVLEHPLRIMLEEQCQTRLLLASMRNASKGYRQPPGSSQSVAEFYRGLEALERDLAEHGQLETECLFPKALELERRAHGRRQPSSGPALTAVGHHGMTTTS